MACLLPRQTIVGAANENTAVALASLHAHYARTIIEQDRIVSIHHYEPLVVGDVWHSVEFKDVPHGTCSPFHREENAAVEDE